MTTFPCSTPSPAAPLSLLVCDKLDNRDKNPTLRVLGEVDAREEKKKVSKFSALAKFQNLDSRGTSSSDDLTTSVQSLHQNAVVEIELYEGDAASATKFSTVGMDGKVVIWDLDEVAKRISIA